MYSSFNSWSTATHQSFIRSLQRVTDDLKAWQRVQTIEVEKNSREILLAISLVTRLSSMGEYYLRFEKETSLVPYLPISISFSLIGRVEQVRRMPMLLVESLITLGMLDINVLSNFTQPRYNFNQLGCTAQPSLCNLLRDTHDPLHSSHVDTRTSPIYLIIWRLLSTPQTWCTFTSNCLPNTFVGLIKRFEHTSIRFYGIPV